MEHNLVSQLEGDYKDGLTPDPELLYNRHVLFGSVLVQATSHLGAEAFATGHYVRTTREELRTPQEWIEGIRLLRAFDLAQDDTFLLSQVPQQALSRCVFPLGEFHRQIVKTIASEAGLAKFDQQVALSGIDSPSSAELINQAVLGTLHRKPGDIKHVESYQNVGIHEGINAWKIGEKMTLGPQDYFVVDKNKDSNTIFVAPGEDHPAQFAENMFLSLANWTQRLPYRFYRKQMMDCRFRLHRNQVLTRCTLTVGMPTPWCGNDHIILSSAEKVQFIIPGHYAAFYQGEECIGSAKIMRAGPSLYAMNYKQLSKQTKSEKPEKRGSLLGSLIQKMSK